MKQYFQALFLSYRPRTDCSISQFLQHKFYSLNIQDDGSTRGLLAKSLKKCSKSAIQPAGSHFWQSPNEWKIIELSFNIINHSLCLFFIQRFYKRFVIFKSVSYARHFEYSCKWCSLNHWKQKAQRFKLQGRLLTINKRNIIRWNIYRDNNFHSQMQGLKCL